MKSTTLKGLVLSVTLMGATLASAQNSVINSSELPANTRSFVTKTFKNQPIVQAEKESTLGYVHEYSVILRDGTTLDFERDGSWEKMENKTKGLPFKAVPSKIAAYVKKAFPKTYIKSIEKDRSEYEVELSNELDLKFDLKGNFKKID